MRRRRRESRQRRGLASCLLARKRQGKAMTWIEVTPAEAAAARLHADALIALGEEPDPLVLAIAEAQPHAEEWVKEQERQSRAQRIEQSIMDGERAMEQSRRRQERGRRAGQGGSRKASGGGSEPWSSPADGKSGCAGRQRVELRSPTQCIARVSDRGSDRSVGRRCGRIGE